MIRNVNTYALIGFLLVAGAEILAISGVLLQYKYKDNGKYTPSKARKNNILVTVWCVTVFGMIVLGVIFALLS